MKKLVKKGLFGMSVIIPPNEKTRNKLGEWFLKGLGAVGKVMTAPFLGPPLSGNGIVYYPRTKEQANALNKLKQEQEKLIGEAMTWVSPLNYGVALATGNGLNAKKGEEKVSSWSPFWQAVGRGAELYVGPKAVKGVKKAPAVIDKGLAKAGNTSAKGRVIARELNKGIKENTKNGRIEVGPEYFKAEDKWYRVSERPEKMGIEELGMNVTTEDLKTNPSTVDKWRRSILSNNVEPGKGTNSGYFVKKPPKINVSIRRTPGRAHGNTSQAAKGQLWSGNFNQSGLFPAGILEGQAPMKVPFGLNRSYFVNTSWEEIPVGGRIGFHTGEMPMSNLGWFQETSNGRYTYEPIIPEKRIQVQERPILVGLPYVRWSQEGYLNEARDVYPKGNPNLFFLIVTDVDNPVKGLFNNQGNGQYSLHFKTKRKEFRGNEKENMFNTVESLIPEGGIVSTWGHVSPGGYHAINRFGNLFGYSKIGERPGVNGPIPIYEKITKPYSGYTPTKQNPAYSKFVQDVMEGFGWGMHRKLRPSKLQDLTSYIEGKERLGYGAENSVYKGPEGIVLKALNGPNPFGKLEIAMKEGQQYVDRFNSRPYNIPLSLEGYTRRAGGYLPVYGQLKVSTNIGDILEKMPKLEKSLNGQYMYYGKPNPNRILLENGIDKALDFKPANLGILPDGTLMGIDLFKEGGKL